MIFARVFLVVAVVIWGWTFIATKVCLRYLSPAELLSLRFQIALPVLLAMILARGTRLSLRRDAGRTLLGSALITLHFLVQITGLRYTSATHTSWIIAVTPLVIALLARTLLGERIGWATASGMGVATLGILLLVSGGRPSALTAPSSVGDWLVLASAHTWALYTIATRDLARRQDSLAVTFLILLPATVVSVPAMAVEFDWSRLARLPLEAVMALLFLGVLGMALAQWFWQEGIARAGAARAGIFLYLEPVATMALAVPYLGERPSAATLAGGLLVLGGVWLAQRRRNAGGGGGAPAGGQGGLTLDARRALLRRSQSAGWTSAQASSDRSSALRTEIEFTSSRSSSIRPTT